MVRWRGELLLALNTGKEQEHRSLSGTVTDQKCLKRVEFI